MMGVVVSALVGCADVPLPPAEQAPSTVAAPPNAAPAVIERGHARWVAAQWGDLPDWGRDRLLEFWPALLRGCAKPAPQWTTVCAEALRYQARNDDDVALWLIQHLSPWRVEASDGNAQGQATGYFEPQLSGARQAGGIYQVPVLGAPADLVPHQAYLTRRQIETELHGQPLAYVGDPLELLIAQVQGSGRLLLKDADGSEQALRLSYAGDNGLPYQSIGAQLRASGELSDASWPGIRDWARRNPDRLRETLWLNPRYVFFRVEPLLDPHTGPRGAQGVALTPGRSVAVDKLAVPLGTPLWLDSTEPLSTAPLRLLVMAQDTGSAIQGAVRIDYFWGWGDQAEAQATRMHQPLKVWALWPR